MELDNPEIVADLEAARNLFSRRRESSTTLRADVTGVLLTKRFAQPALTWVLSLCIIYSPRFDRRVFVFGTAMTTLRDIVHSLLKPSLWLFRTDRSPLLLLLLEFVEIRDVSLPRRDFCVASR